MLRTRISAIRVRTMLQFEATTVMFKKVGISALRRELPGSIRALKSGSLHAFLVTFRSAQMGWLYSHAKATDKGLRGHRVFTYKQFIDRLPEIPVWIVNEKFERVAFWNPMEAR